MYYKDVEKRSPAKFKRLTGVKRAVFELMLSVVKQANALSSKHPTRWMPAKLSQAAKLLLMYYREYRTLFHIGVPTVSPKAARAKSYRKRKPFW